MRFVSVDLKGLSDFKRRIDSLNGVKKDRILRQATKDLANHFVGDVKKVTPVDTGNLRKNWEFDGKVANIEGTYQALVKNETEYASWVEYGHAQRVGQFVPPLKKRLVKPYVKGQFFMRNAATKLQENASKIVEDQVVKELEKTLNGE